MAVIIIKVLLTKDIPLISNSEIVLNIRKTHDFT